MVAGRGLAAEDECARLHLGVGVGFDAVVQRHDVQHVEMLALVLVDTLDLHVEQRFRIDRDAGRAPHVGGQILLDRALDETPFARGNRNPRL